jgi:hypothetical protein
MMFNYRIQLMRVLVSLMVFIRLRNTLPYVKRHVMQPNEFLGYLKRGIACLVSPFEHEQYPSNSMDQNIFYPWCYRVAQQRYCVASRFCWATQYLFKFQKIEYGAQTILRLPEWGITHSLSILFYELDYNIH